MTKCEDFQKQEIISRNLSEEVDKRSSSILELQGQILSKEEELVNARQRLSELEVLVEKAKCELNTILDSVSTTEDCISLNNLRKEEILNKVAMEVNELNNLVALNKNLKIRKS